MVVRFNEAPGFVHPRIGVAPKQISDALGSLSQSGQGSGPTLLVHIYCAVHAQYMNDLPRPLSFALSVSMRQDTTEC
jgi:hypothetical protein